MKSRAVRGLVVRAAVLLAAGAVVNVAVAWGCAWWSLTHYAELEYGRDDEERKRMLDEALSRGFRCVVFDGAQGSLAFGIDSGQGYQKLHVFPYSLYRYTGYHEFSAGYPCKALEGYWMRSTDQDPWEQVGGIAVTRPMDNGDRRLIPYTPMWPGFLVNSLFYGAIVWGIFAATFTMRRMIRRKQNLCSHCGYPIGVSDVCTECGVRVKDGEA
ncbi:MAG TPA: hypothetical protein VG711_01210 [Phycisphaerales bacterium]|nr:hypothetical protein [Phycisphaerales bacterium]